MSNTLPPAMPATAAPSTDAAQLTNAQPFMSVMYSPNQIEAMNAALKTFKNIGSSQGAEKLDITVDTQPKLQEPTLYPVFYLSSIVYHNANDWTVWVKQSPSSQAVQPPSQNDAAATPGAPIVPNTASAEQKTTLIAFKPTTKNNDITLVSVSAENATFTWKPSYISAIVKRHQTNGFSPVKPVTHRLANKRDVTLDMNQLVARFTLRPNQSFASAYFNAFEGMMEPSAPPNIGVQNLLPIASGMSSNTAKQVSTLLDPAQPPASPTSPQPPSSDGKTEMKNVNQ